MLTFTQEQGAAVVAARRTFNGMMANMAEGIPADAALTFHGNALPIPRDVWGEWDREAVTVQRDVLAVFNDLSMDLSVPVPIGKLVHYFPILSDSGSTVVTMDGRGEGKKDQATIDYAGVPVPITTGMFGFGWRQIEAMRTEGASALDTATRDNQNRKVAEDLEAWALYGVPGIDVGGAKVHGILNHPKRATRATSITLNGESGPNWVAEIVATLKLLHDNNFRVGVTLYMNWDDWFYAGNTDYSPQYEGKTILDRIREIANVDRVVPASRIPANAIVAVVKRRQVIRILNAMPMNTTPVFRKDPTDDYDFRVMASAVPQIRYDAEDQCGIATSL